MEVFRDLHMGLDLTVSLKYGLLLTVLHLYIWRMPGDIRMCSKHEVPRKKSVPQPWVRGTGRGTETKQIDQRWRDLDCEWGKAHPPPIPTGKHMHNCFTHHVPGRQLKPRCASVWPRRWVITGAGQAAHWLHPQFPNNNKGFSHDYMKSVCYRYIDQLPNRTLKPYTD